MPPVSTQHMPDFAESEEWLTLTPMIVANPARLSPELTLLFPQVAGVVAAELSGEAPAGILTAAERQSISHCADKRIRDFTAGRACARRALSELGIPLDFSLLSAPDRAPIWPPNVVGSITHTKGFRAAAVARSDAASSLGLDSEEARAVDPELWGHICSPPEIEILAELERSNPEAARLQAGVIFAAKEAFYKCQYPLTHQWVGFEDVVIDTPAAQPGTFRVIPQKPLGLDSGLVRALAGRFVLREQWVIAGIAVPTRP